MRVIALVLLASQMSCTHAQDEDALLLADQSVTTEIESHPWMATAEAAMMGSTRRGKDELQYSERLSLDVRIDQRLARSLRAVFANRLDAHTFDGQVSAIDTLKEAYLTWQPRADCMLDVGRINVRNGIAVGYNPTDYFRAGAVRSVVSIEPSSLRDNRMGAAMIRAQMLWQNGSITALYAPRITSTPSSGTFDPNWSASNGASRWLFAMTEQITKVLNPQLLIYDSSDRRPQLGINVSYLINNATVGYVEWSAGQSAMLAAHISGDSPAASFHSRWAAGLTYTAPVRLSLTLEYEQNDAAPDATQWEVLRRGSPTLLGSYLRFVGDQQELATRRAWLGYVRWQDAMTHHLDVTGFMRTNMQDHSRLGWLEGRYHRQSVDIALQWQASGGVSQSVFGALSRRRTWQLIVSRYFS